MNHTGISRNTNFYGTKFSMQEIRNMCRQYEERLNTYKVSMECESSTTSSIQYEHLIKDYKQYKTADILQDREITLPEKPPKNRQYTTSPYLPVYTKYFNTNFIVESDSLLLSCKTDDDTQNCVEEITEDHLPNEESSEYTCLPVVPGSNFEVFAAKFSSQHNDINDFTFLPYKPDNIQFSRRRALLLCDNYDKIKIENAKDKPNKTVEKLDKVDKPNEKLEMEKQKISIEIPLIVPPPDSKNMEGEGREKRKISVKYRPRTTENNGKTIEDSVLLKRSNSVRKLRNVINESAPKQKLSVQTHTFQILPKPSKHFRQILINLLSHQKNHLQEEVKNQHMSALRKKILKKYEYQTDTGLSYDSSSFSCIGNYVSMNTKTKGSSVNSKQKCREEYKRARLMKKISSFLYKDQLLKKRITDIDKEIKATERLNVNQRTPKNYKSTKNTDNIAKTCTWKANRSGNANLKKREKQPTPIIQELTDEDDDDLFASQQIKQNLDKILKNKIKYLMRNRSISDVKVSGGQRSDKRTKKMQNMKQVGFRSACSRRKSASSKNSSSTGHDDLDHKTKNNQSDKTDVHVEKNSSVRFAMEINQRIKNIERLLKQKLVNKSKIRRKRMTTDNLTTLCTELGIRPNCGDIVSQIAKCHRPNEVPSVHAPAKTKPKSTYMYMPIAMRLNERKSSGHQLHQNRPHTANAYTGRTEYYGQKLSSNTKYINTQQQRPRTSDCLSKFSARYSNYTNNNINKTNSYNTTANKQHMPSQSACTKYKNHTRHKNNYHYKYKHTQSNDMFSGVNPSDCSCQTFNVSSDQMFKLQEEGLGSLLHKQMRVRDKIQCLQSMYNYNMKMWNK